MTPSETNGGKKAGERRVARRGAAGSELILPDFILRLAGGRRLRWADREAGPRHLRD